MSVTLKPSFSMLALICDVASGIAVSTRMWPCGDVIRYDARPSVPT